MAVTKRTSSNVLLDTALKNFYSAAEEMGLDEGLVEILSRAERKLCVSIPVTMDDGTVKVASANKDSIEKALNRIKGRAALSSHARH